MPKVGIRLVLALPYSNAEVGCMGCRLGLYSIMMWLSHGGAHVGLMARVHMINLGSNHGIAKVMGTQMS